MNYRQEYEKWLASPALSEDERNELKAIANDEKEIENRFYGPLEFGTAGLRGTMYVGLHNMNRHVIRWATQGFANVIRAEGEEAMKKGVAICMDCRNHSMEFARAAACVMAGNGITVKLFESLRPTPELSFAVREYGCEAGINVTASHNPKEYNGSSADTCTAATTSDGSTAANDGTADDGAANDGSADDGTINDGSGDVADVWTTAGKCTAGTIPDIYWSSTGEFSTGKY